MRYPGDHKMRGADRRHIKASMRARWQYGLTRNVILVLRVEDLFGDPGLHLVKLVDRTVPFSSLKIAIQRRIDTAADLFVELIRAG
jgi:hypothetical protein